MTQMMPISQSVSLRKSLARGFARQVFDAARHGDPGDAALWSALGEIPRKGKGLARWAAKVRRLPGVLSLTRRNDGKIAIEIRKVATGYRMTNRGDVFAEEILIYTRYLVSSISRRGCLYQAPRVSFSSHSLQRYVERSNASLGAGFEDGVYAEARRLLSRMEDELFFEDGGDHYFPTRDDGLWAGALEETNRETWWRPVDDEWPCLWLAIRTFLSPDQLRPTVRDRWVEAREDDSHQGEAAGQRRATAP